MGLTSLIIQENNRELEILMNFNFHHANQSQIEKLLLAINTCKSCGYDMIPKLIRDSAAVIARPLTNKIDSSIGK